MATATSRKPAAKKSAAKRVPAKKAAASKASSLPGAARDLEKAVSDALHRELKLAKKLLETVEKDVRGIVDRIEKTVDEMSGRKSASRKPAAKKAAPKKAAAKRPAAKR